MWKVALRPWQAAPHGSRAAHRSRHRHTGEGSFRRAGEQSILETKCLAEQNNGLYIPVEAEDDLIAAFEKTLGCPVLSQSTTLSGSPGANKNGSERNSFRRARRLNPPG